MAKPKFTPDPAPIQGPSEPIEAYVKRVVAWQKAINDRIEDWWPIPLEDRVADLETRNPQLTGTWPIVDYATVTFLPIEAQAFVGFVCQDNSFFRISADYSTYTEIPVAGLTNGFESLWTSGETKYFAYGDNKFWYSTNSGSTWTSYQLAHLSNGVGGLRYSNGFWYAFGHGTVSQSAGLYVYKSSDFINWSTIYSTNTGPSPEATMNVASTDKNGKWLLNTSTVDTVLTSDDDCLNWAQVTATDSRYADQSYYVNGLWFLTGRRRLIMTSPDRNTWTTRSYSTLSVYLNSLMHSVVYGDGKWRAINGATVCELWNGGANGTSWSLLDGSSVCTSDPDTLIYVNGYGWLMGGQNLSGAFDLGYSSDGTNFSAIDPPGYSPADVKGIYLTEAVTV